MADLVTKIINTKQYGYDFVEAQGSIKLGLDIDYFEASNASWFDSETYTPVYTSINSEGASKKNEGDEGDDVYPVDEKGAVNTGKTTKIVVETDSFQMNKSNPVHLYLARVADKEELGKNIPFRYEDFALNTALEGRVNIEVELEAVGGEKRKITPVFTFIGKPTLIEA